MSADLQLPAASRSLGFVLRRHTAQLFVPLGLMWAVQIVSVLPFLQLWRFGIRPRTVAGLWGIPLAPFLHGGFPHLLANTVPFLLLGALVLLGGVRLFQSVSVFAVLAGGFGVWLIGGSGTTHIGASGLVFGYLGFLLARGWVERSIPWLLLSLFLLFAYGGLLFGMLPFQYGISWQSHLCGFLAGLAAAPLCVRRRALPH